MYGYLPYTVLMSSPTKDERIEIRVTAGQKASIRAAAAIEGRTVTDFSVSALTEYAAAVVQRDRELRVDAESLEVFFQTLDRPARSLRGLQELLTRDAIFVD